MCGCKLEINSKPFSFGCDTIVVSRRLWNKKTRKQKGLRTFEWVECISTHFHSCICVAQPRDKFPYNARAINTKNLHIEKLTKPTTMLRLPRRCCRHRCCCGLFYAIFPFLFGADRQSTTQVKPQNIYMPPPPKKKFKLIIRKKFCSRFFFRVRGFCFAIVDDACTMFFFRLLLFHCRHPKTVQAAVIVCRWLFRGKVLPKFNRAMCLSLKLMTHYYCQATWIPAPLKAPIPSMGK